MLHRVRDVGIRTCDADGFQRLIEDATGRADERLASEVFLIAWLLTDEENSGAAAALPEHRLGRVQKKRTATTSSSGFTQRGQGDSIRQERLGRHRDFGCPHGPSVAGIRSVSATRSGGLLHWRTVKSTVYRRAPAESRLPHRPPNSCLVLRLLTFHEPDDRLGGPDRFLLLDEDSPPCAASNLRSEPSR